LKQRGIGRAADLGTVQNRLWFTLRRGGNPHAGLQAAWIAHGSDAFTIEVLERIDDEALSFIRERIFAERLAHWCRVHSGEAI
jgi:hypothetical protein